MDDAVINVVPTYGAVVRADFKTHIGLKVIMTITHNGKPIPFGATASLAASQSSGIVGDGGQVYLSGLPLSGKINVKWGNSAAEQCVASYQLPVSSKKQVLSYTSADCQ